MTANPLSTIPPLGPGGRPPHQPNGPFKPVDPMRLLRQHMTLLIVTGIIGVVLGVGAWALLRVFNPRYTSIAQLEVSPPLSNVADPMRSTWQPGQSTTELEQKIASEIYRIKSDGLLESALNQADLRTTEWFQQFITPDLPSGDIRAARQDLQDNTLSTSAIRNTALIQMAVGTKSQDDASVILSGIINVYLAELKRQAASLNIEKQRLYSQEKERAQAEVDRLSERLQRFARENDMDSLSERNSAAMIEHDLRTRQLMMLRNALSETQAIYAGLRASMEAGAAPSADIYNQVVQMPELMQKRVEIDSYRIEIKTLLDQDYRPEHRAVRQMERRIANLEQQYQQSLEQKIAEYQQAQLAGTAKAIESLQMQVDELVPTLEEAKRRMSDLAGKLEEHQLLTQQMETARSKLEESQRNLDALRVAGDHPDAVRVKTMISPTRAELTSPKPHIVVPGITLLLLGGVTGLLFLREMLDQRLKSPADVKMMVDTTLLGVLPNANEDPSGATKIERIVERQPAGLLAESFRQVRTAILSKMDRRGYKTLMVVSARPESGTSAVAQNLATSLAFNGRRVLIVDANLRRPGQHKLMGADNDCGLVDVLSGEMTPEQVIRPIDGVSLWVLPTGHAAEAHPELLEGQGFRSLLAKLETIYDMIIIDAPPALLTSDCQLLAKQVDAIVMVVRAGRDKRGMIERMMRQLDGQRADLLGMILNGVKSSAGGYFRKSYEEFYRYRQTGNGSALPRGGESDKRKRITAQVTDQQ